MIRINLLPVKESESAFKRRQQVSAAALVLSVMLLLMVVPYVLQKRAIGRLDAETNQLRAEIATYDAQAKEARDLDKRQRDLQSKLQIIRDLDDKRVGPARVLADLSRAVPEKLWLEEFAESGGAATLVGWALDNQTVADFMRKLAASSYFYNVDLSEATQPENSAEQVRSLVSTRGPVRFKRFVIRANLDYFGRGGKPNVNGAEQPTEQPKADK